MKNKMIFYSVLFVFSFVSAAEKSPITLRASLHRQDGKSRQYERIGTCKGIEFFDKNDVRSKHAYPASQIIMSDCSLMLIDFEKDAITHGVLFEPNQLVGKLIFKEQKLGHAEDCFFEITCKDEKITIKIDAKVISRDITRAIRDKNISINCWE